MKTEIFESYDAFLNRKDKTANGVSTQFANKYPNWKEMNETNTGCWNCVECEDCSSCKECKTCQMCVECEMCENLIAEFWKLHNTKSINEGRKIKKEDLVKIYFQYQIFDIEKEKFLKVKEWTRLWWFGIWIILYFMFLESYTKETNLDIVLYWGMLILSIGINLFVIELLFKWVFAKEKRNLVEKEFELKKEFVRIIECAVKSKKNQVSIKRPGIQ